MDDPAELTESNLALKQRMRHCECQMRGICRTCKYFVKLEMEVIDELHKQNRTPRSPL